MIKGYVTDIALQMGVKLSKISLVDGQTLGCRDLSLLNISSMGCIASALIYPADLRDLETGVVCVPLELRIRATLSRLQMLIKAKVTSTSHYFGESDYRVAGVKA
jgi:hypothetical protein